VADLKVRRSGTIHRRSGGQEKLSSRDEDLLILSSSLDCSGFYELKFGDPRL
jgi:hypothetical protein